MNINADTPTIITPTKANTAPTISCFLIGSLINKYENPNVEAIPIPFNICYIEAGMKLRDRY